MKNTETKVSEKLVKIKVKRILEIYAKHHDLYTLCPMTCGYGESGHPDRLVLINGHLLGIEAKRDDRSYHFRPHLKPTMTEAAQARQAERIKAAGGDWICVHNDNLHELVIKLDEYTSYSPAVFSEYNTEQLAKIVG